MANPINEKIVTKHSFSAKGILNIDKLPDNVFIIEVEEEGEVDLKKYLKRFNGEFLKIGLEKQSEQSPEDEVEKE